MLRAFKLIVTGQSDFSLMSDIKTLHKEQDMVAESVERYNITMNTHCHKLVPLLI